jgi:chromosome segregation ATPase
MRPSVGPEDESSQPASLRCESHRPSSRSRSSTATSDIWARQAEREFLIRKLARADTERRKLLDAYYAAAIDVTTLKTEQARIAADVRSAEERLAAVDAHLAEWQEILETAMRFATNCATAYARASTATRRRFNQAVFTRIEVRDGKLAADLVDVTSSTCSPPRL